MKKNNLIEAVNGLMAFACGVITAQASTITIPGGSVTSLGEAPTSAELTPFFKGFKTIGTAVSGICAITSLIFFVISVARLSTSAGNDMMRSRALKGILISGISLALFGGITVVVGIFWNAI